MLRYLRHSTYKALLRPISKHFRTKRMENFRTKMGIKEGLSVLDFGGQPGIWATVPEHLEITILNLPAVAESRTPSHHSITYVEGDACERQEWGDPDRFDLVFSNSVIEHVGPAERRAAFARELRRLGKPYWVQTPCKWFPVEPHCGMPFWWFYPKWLQRYFLAGWHKKLPAWTDSMEQTTFVTREELRELFPEAVICVETMFAMPKSYVVYSRSRAGAARDATSAEAVSMATSVQP